MVDCVLNTVINTGIKNFSYKNEFEINKNSVFIPTSNERTLNKTFGIAKGIQANIEKAFNPTKYGNFTGVNKRLNGYEVIIDIPKTLRDAYDVIDGKKSLTEVNKSVNDNQYKPPRDLFNQDNNISSNKSILVKEGVSELFESNPELDKIGTQQQYSQYIDTIFPNSKVKDIVYHGTTKKFDKFEKGFGKFSDAFWFDKNGTYKFDYQIKALINSINPFFYSNSQIEEVIKNKYGKEQSKELNKYLNNPSNRQIYVSKDVFELEGEIIESYAIYDTDGNFIKSVDSKEEGEDFIKQNSFEVSKVKEEVIEFYMKYTAEQHPDVEGGQLIKKEGIEELQKAGFDSLQHHDYKAVFEPEQIHILGSKQDIEGFKEFVRNNNIGSDENISFNSVDYNDSSRILSDNIMSYYNLKKEIIEFKQNQLQKYKDVNFQKNRHTKEYKDYTNKLENEIQKLQEELLEINITDIDSVLDFMLKDLDIIQNYLNNATNETLLKDRNLLKNVLDTFGRLIEGRNITNDDKIDLEETPLSQYKIDFSQFTDATPFRNKFDDIRAKFEERELDAFKQILDENPNITRLKEEKNMTNDDLISQIRSSKEDITLLSSWFMGANAVDDRLPIQLIKVEMSKEETKFKAVTDPLKKDLDTIYEKLKESKFDMSKFRQTDKNGIKTFDLVTQFSSDWFSDFSDFLKKGNKIWEVKFKEKAKLYRERIVFLNDNTEVIDIRRISSIADKYSQVYPEEFTFSQEEIKEYEDNLKNLLGNSYDFHIQKVVEQLDRFQEFTEYQINNNKRAGEFILQKNPFAFLKNYYSNETSVKVSPIGKNTKGYDVFSDIAFLHIIPKNNHKNYYSQDFADIQADENAFEYWKKQSEIFVNIFNPIYNSNGKSRYQMSLPKFKKDLLEEFKQLFSSYEGDRSKFKDTMSFFRKSLKEWKEMGYEVGTSNRGSKEVISNYIDTTDKRIAKNEKILLTKKLNELISIAKQLGLDTSHKDSNQLANMIAKTEILNEYSDDIHSTTKALLDMSSMEVARRNVSEKVDIIRDRHLEGGENRKHSNTKFDRTVSKVVLNQNNVARGLQNKSSRLVSADGMSKNAYDKLTRLGISKSIAKEIHRAMVLFSEEEAKIFDRLIQLSIDAQNENIAYSFNLNGVKYAYNSVENKYLTTIDTLVTEISKEEYLNNLEKHIREEIKNMGSGISLLSPFIYIRNLVVKKFMVFNPISGLKNRQEGIFTGTRMDLSGKYWTPGNYDKARNIMKWANTLDSKAIKLLSKNKYAQDKSINKINQLKTFKQLLERFDVLQDRSNELARNKDQDSLGELNGILYDWSIGSPEYKNQGSIMLSILMDLKINSVENPNDFNIDFIDEKGNFTIYKDGTLELKDEYKTAENILNWENFQMGDAQNLKENQFFLSKQEITEAINTQSNFDKNDSTYFAEDWFLNHFFTFMKWMPPQMHMRYAQGGGLDVISGKEFKDGLYTQLVKSSPASTLTFLGSTALKNIGTIGFGGTLLAGGGIFSALLGAGTLGYGAYSLYQTGKISKNNFGNLFNEMNSADISDLLGGLVNQLNYITKIAKGVISIPLTTVGIGNTNDIMNFGDKYLAKNLTEEDIAVINATAMELSQSAISIATFFIATAMIKGLDGDDDETDFQKNSYNFACNQILSFAEAMDTYTSPKAFIEERSKVSFLQFLEKWTKIFNSDEFATQGFASKSVGEQLMRSVLFTPKVIDDLSQGLTPFESEYNIAKTEWYYKEAQDMVSNNEYSMKKEIKKIRSDYKQDLLDNPEYENLTSKQADKKANKEVNEIFGTQKDYKTVEEYHDNIVEKNKEIEEISEDNE